MLVSACLTFECVYCCAKAHVDGVFVMEGRQQPRVCAVGVIFVERDVFSVSYRGVVPW